MAHQSDLIASDIHAYLQSQEEKSLLRFITCGSVDDGKSTLIGRLLWDSKMIFEDQLATLTADSKRIGTQGEKIDYALLLDGLQAEREQGITIDVAYRYFSTDKRKFIVADTPGHEQYTRNMVTGASTAQVAVILVDARKGLLTQTRRHSYLVSLVGIRHIVLAINKMDLVAYDAARFAALEREYRAFAAPLGFAEITAIPISALEGDNILVRSARTPWYAGPTLMEQLETVAIADVAATQPFRLPVQWVNRPHLDFRGFAGTIAAGTIRPGDRVVVAASGRSSRVSRIVTLDGDLPVAIAGQAVTLTLEDEIDISRGDLLASADQPPEHTERCRARLVWLHEEPLVAGRGYLLKSGAATVPVSVDGLEHKVNVNTLAEEPGTGLALNEVGVARLHLDRPLAFDRYRDNRVTGSFILIDRVSNATVAAGMFEAPLAAGAEETASAVDRRRRAALKGQPPLLLWFSGRHPGASADAARAVESRLHRRGLHTALLDDARLGDGLNRDLGSDATGQEESLRRASEAARLLLDAGLIVVVSSDVPLRAVQLLLADEPLTVVNVDDDRDAASLCEAVLRQLEPLLAAKDIVSPGIIC
ncbi:MAG: bifunctional sulfate adenylyltransferase subunit 1/adenylylsulfate kinase [Desulfuromonadales bacterium GWC2_61_20]|nr:MAG: bifunctional sulfate adenylyltransferase subunit 1/adenylylsulfate kinase [Desulfuromonadales bacterium GWC2_61_20]